MSRIEKNSRKCKSIDEIATLFNKIIFDLVKTDKIAIAIIEGKILRSINTIGKRVLLDLNLNQPSINARTIKSKTTQNVTDTHLDPDYFPGQVNGIGEIRSELCVPIIYEGTVLGTINLESRNVSNYSVKDAHIVEEYAKVLAKFIHVHRKQTNLIKQDEDQPVRQILGTTKSALIEEWYETLSESEFKEKVVEMILYKLTE